MKHTHTLSLIAGLLHAAPDAPKGSTAPAAPAVPPFFAMVPYALKGFKLAIQKAYPNEAEKVTNQHIADVVLALRIEGIKDPDAQWFCLGTITRVVQTGTNKVSYRFTLPAAKKGAGAYFTAIINNQSTDHKMALEDWKHHVLTVEFKAWAKAENLGQRLGSKSGSAVGFSSDVEIDIDSDEA